MILFIYGRSEQADFRQIDKKKTEFEAQSCNPFSFHF